MARITKAKINYFPQFAGSQVATPVQTVYQPAPAKSSKMGLIVAIALILIIAVVVVIVVVASSSSTTASSSGSTTSSDSSNSGSSNSGSDSTDTGTSVSFDDIGADAATTKVSNQINTTEYDTFVGLSPVFDCCDCTGGCDTCTETGQSALDTACKSYYGTLAEAIQDVDGTWANNYAAGKVGLCNGFCKVPIDDQGYVKNQDYKLTDVYACSDCSGSMCSSNGEEQAKNHCQMVYGSNSAQMENGDNYGWGTNTYAGSGLGLSANCSGFCSGGIINPESASLGDYDAY